jgi:hypothetical protein
MSTSKAWVIAGLLLAVSVGVLVFALQANGTIDDPAQLICDTAVRRGDCD